MRVDLETIWLMIGLRTSINTTDLKDIEFYQNGEKIDICGAAKNEFELTGLNNIDFITTGKYKTRKGFDNTFPRKIMTPSQLIMQHIILDYYEYNSDSVVSTALTSDNIDDIYDDLNEDGELQDYESELREGTHKTNINPEYSRHYESESVACKLQCGTWVGWTYWYGGGKHSDPDSIEWMEDAYFLTLKEYEKTVTIHEFTKL